MFDRVEELPVPWAAGRRSNGDSREAHARRGDLRPRPQVCLQSFYLSAQRKWTLLKGATPPVCPQESDHGPQDRPTAVSPAKAPAWSVCSAGHARWFSSTPRPSRDAHVSWPTPAAPIAFE